jgi:hypothetical protein
MADGDETRTWAVRITTIAAILVAVCRLHFIPFFSGDPQSTPVDNVGTSISPSISSTMSIFTLSPKSPGRRLGQDHASHSSRRCFVAPSSTTFKTSIVGMDRSCALRQTRSLSLRQMPGPTSSSRGLLLAALSSSSSSKIPPGGLDNLANRTLY